MSLNKPIRNSKIKTAAAISEHFSAVHSSYSAKFPDQTAFLERHLFFITVSFNLRSSRFESRFPTQLAEFGRLYFQISEFLLGNNLNRKRKLQPLTYAFTDFEGSRLRKSDVVHNQFPHIHALLLVTPEYLNQFKSAVFVPRLRSRVRSIKDIKIENYSSQKGTVERLASYCMKGYVQSSRSYGAREDLWSIFPR